MTKLTLMGPDDQGFWYLVDATGRDFRIVEQLEDHPVAAKLFGWVTPDESADDEAIEDAREFLLEHVGDEVIAPPHIASRFMEEQ
jgi:hypothetical protein